MSNISAILPTRNRGDYLRTAVESLLAQTSPPAEILIVNDGGTLDSAIATLTPTIRVLNNQRRGAVPARVLGVQAARESAILFLDDDDWLTDRGYLARTGMALAHGADFCFCDGDMVFDSGAPPLTFARDADAASLARDNTILVSGVCYRRGLHDRLGHFDVSLPYYWDWDWYLRVARSGARLERGMGAAVAIRVHDGNMSGESNAAERRANLDRLAMKHGLGPLALKNHVSLLHEPA